MPFALAADGARLAFTIYPALPGPDGDTPRDTPRDGRRAGGRPTLLIAGQALGRASWDPILPRLRAAGPVIAFDHRGVGASDDVFPRRWTTREQAADAVAVLDAAGAERAAVYGFSMGGRAAQWLAADHADRVRALILGGTSAGDRIGVPRPEESLRILLRSDRRALLELFFTPQWLHAHPDRASAITAVPRSLPAQRAHFAASTDHDGAEALSAITAPTLILHGGDDRMCVADNARILGERIRGAETRIYPGARHGYHFEVEAAGTDTVEFLRGT